LRSTIRKVEVPVGLTRRHPSVFNSLWTLDSPHCYRASHTAAVYPRAIRRSVRLSIAWIVTKRKKLLPTFFCCDTIMVGGNIPFYLKFWGKWPTPFKNGDFQSIFARSASAITPTEISHTQISRENVLDAPTRAQRPRTKSIYEIVS